LHTPFDGVYDAVRGVVQDGRCFMRGDVCVGPQNLELLANCG
jgi:hypothetical protein